MVYRMQRGYRDGVFGAWISKPGYDVTTSAPGDFMLDTNSRIYQIVMAGDTSIFVAGAATYGAGDYTVSVGLPSDFAGVSNLIAHAIYYALKNDGTILSFGTIASSYLKYHITGGVLYLTSNQSAGGGYGGGVTYDYRASWIIYRAQF